MDQARLRKLAGVDDTKLNEEYQASIDELNLLEKTYHSKYDYSVDTETMTIEEMQRRLEAASRALGIANRLRDPTYRKQHLSRIMTNMNIIRAALNHMISSLTPDELENY